MIPCDHEWEHHEGHADHRYRCRKCGVLSYLHERHRKRGKLHTIFSCGFTTMQDLGDGGPLKRRSACSLPAVAWHGELCYCRAHVPVPRGMAEEERRLRVEREADEAWAKIRWDAAKAAGLARLEFASVARPLPESRETPPINVLTGTVFW